MAALTALRCGFAVDPALACRMKCAVLSTLFHPVMISSSLGRCGVSSNTISPSESFSIICVEVGRSGIKGEPHSFFLNPLFLLTKSSTFSHASPPMSPTSPFQLSLQISPQNENPVRASLNFRFCPRSYIKHQPQTSRRYSRSTSAIGTESVARSSVLAGMSCAAKIERPDVGEVLIKKRGDLGRDLLKMETG